MKPAAYSIARPSAAPVLAHGPLTLDTTTHLAAVNGVPVRLTRTEYAILKLLMLNPGQVLPKPVLLELIAQDTPDCTESSLKLHICHLRRKLRQAAGADGGFDCIEAVWGIGFRLAAPPTA